MHNPCISCWLDDVDECIGLAAAEWYHTDVPRKVMKELMQRSDQPAIRDTNILYGCMIAFAAGGIALWGTWWCVPFWAAYGVLYGSASDSRWHECSHGTAFKTPWMNDAVYQIASFHPEYRFADADADDAANYTNRSPYPMLHLLREASLESAIANYPDADAIPDNNIAKARALGSDYWLKLMSGLHSTDLPSR